MTSARGWMHRGGKAQWSKSEETFSEIYQNMLYGLELVIR